VSKTSSVLVGCVERTAWVKVEGRGTFQNSAGLKEYVKQMIQRGFRDFVVDLQDCEQMDSTFMGTLAGVALRLREIGQGGLKAINVNERNLGLLSSLGLDQLFQVEAAANTNETLPEEPQLKEAVPSTPVDPSTQKQTVLEAHEALAEADSANAVKFRDVLDFLRQELNAPDSEEGRDG
jgi:anti-anti-sigma factor